MEPKSLSRPRINRVCYYRSRCESNPLFRAVRSNDLEELKSLVEAGNSVNIPNSEGYSLLNFVMRLKRVEIFNYLLSVNEIDINMLDQLENVRFDEYFARRLIERGVNIHLTDNRGITLLHWVAKSKSEGALSFGQFLIEKGANINQQDYSGNTPLYAACECGNFDLVCMLLYYGADAAIATDEGVLPLSIRSDHISEAQLQLQQILFDYTFDNNKIVIRLPTLVGAMTLNSDLFSKILDNIYGIDYDLIDLQYMVFSLRHVKSKHFKLFIEKFGYIVREMIDNFPFLDVFFGSGFYLEHQGLKEIVELFLNSDFIADFAQSSLPENPTISYLLEMFSGVYEPVDVESFTKSVCLMLSYGLTVTSTDLDSVFERFGNCELFQILLHMEITMKSNFGRRQSIAVLFYDPFSTIDQFSIDVYSCSTLLDYYNNSKLKEFATAKFVNNSEVLEKLKKLPQVPLLVELSRDAARKYIVKRFDVHNSVQFYTILRWLPIGEMNRSIIALDKKIY